MPMSNPLHRERIIKLIHDLKDFMKLDRQKRNAVIFPLNTAGQFRLAIGKKPVDPLTQAKHYAADHDSSLPQKKIDAIQWFCLRWRIQFPAHLAMALLNWEWTRARSYSAYANTVRLAHQHKRPGRVFRTTPQDIWPI